MSEETISLFLKVGTHEFKGEGPREFVLEAKDIWLKEIVRRIHDGRIAEQVLEIASLVRKNEILLTANECLKEKLKLRKKDAHTK